MQRIIFPSSLTSFQRKNRGKPIAGLETYYLWLPFGLGAKPALVSYNQRLPAPRGASCEMEARNIFRPYKLLATRNTCCGYTITPLCRTLSSCSRNLVPNPPLSCPRAVHKHCLERTERRSTLKVKLALVVSVDKTLSQFRSAREVRLVYWSRAQ